MTKVRALTKGFRVTRLLVFFCLVLILFCRTSLATPPDSNWVRERSARGDFPLVSGSQVADILISSDDFSVVNIAAQNLAQDVERVTGRKPKLLVDKFGASRIAVIVGTLNKSSLINSLVHSGRLKVAQLQGQWESFLIATIDHPLPNIAKGLVIVGSDRRGTAYGAFELSRAVGVSPWYWWADVAPTHHDNLFVAAGTRREGPPSVKYRGIFLNDEDLGLQPWAAKTFDPEFGDIGPKTYARIFELLLRLKANTLWPAMHGCTKAFNIYAQNKVVADEYAIVMGSSHAEPMLRNNVTEWTDKPENYDYTKNPEGVRKYWNDRAAQNGRYESIYTLGMRGIHDSPIQGPKTPAERIEVLEKIFGDQRSILASHVNPDAASVPQIFCPYKEVLTDYRNGLKVPDDVTIVFPDDNFGYIRYLPTAEERKRSGGFGIYYHVSYLGGPLSYLWLDTTPPALIWEEMSKAYDHGVRKLWMLNVGDIKPAEISIELFMQMGWDISRWQRENLNDFLTHWAKSQFGPRYASETAVVMQEYYRLGFARKPEHLQWNLVNEKPKPSELTPFDYGDEMQRRLDEYDALRKRVDLLYSQIPVMQRDSFYELVVYPVRSAALANRRYFAFEKSARYLEQGRASAAEWARRAREADAKMNAEADYFNQKLAGGKWKRMMTVEPPNGQWQNMRMMNPVAPAALSQLSVPVAAGLGVAIEGRAEPVRAGEQDATLPTLSVFTRETRFIDVFNYGQTPANWTAATNENWIKLSKAGGTLGQDARITVSIDWSNAPAGESISGIVEIKGANESRVVRVPIFNPAVARFDKVGFVESNGVLAFEAENFTSRFDRGGAGWQLIPGLGRSGDSIAIFPTTAASIDLERIKAGAPHVEYAMQLFSQGKVEVTAYLVPTHPIQAGRGLRYALAFDDQAPQIVTVGANLQLPSRAWSMNVLNNSTTGSSVHEIATGGRHVLKLYMVDAGVVVDKIVVNTGGLRPAYLGPVETRVAGSAGPSRKTRAQVNEH